MKKNVLLFSLISVILWSGIAFRALPHTSSTQKHFAQDLRLFQAQVETFISDLPTTNKLSSDDQRILIEKIYRLRENYKKFDFWLRYLDPIAQKKMNGPLPVEWETEVFEKYEKPYRREGAGLSLAELYLQNEEISLDSIRNLIQPAIASTVHFLQDSIQSQLLQPSTFYFANRLFLLNLAVIYTTGFECPSTERLIPELRLMILATEELYTQFNSDFPNEALQENYLSLFKNLRQYVNQQSEQPELFDHFDFISKYINPLFSLNQERIQTLQLKSKSTVDYSLNNNSKSIFSKTLYKAQNIKGVYSRVQSAEVMAQIKELGHLLFFDPILSGNNQRSCASCHKADQYFSDTITATSLQFNNRDFLPRNTPSLINAPYNHLIMLDGKHNTLQEQGRAVITNAVEMSCSEKEVLAKLKSSKFYYRNFKALLAYTPQEPELSMEHITSALTVYYGSFSSSSSAFDRAINKTETLNAEAKQGFNLFMSKAQCATCHFVPQFNGVKPPYLGSEFEVLGVPSDTLYTEVSKDEGRYKLNPATETLHAFRTGSLRNISHTAPYMHNGVFRSLEEVIDFYDAGGAVGRGLKLENQTLSSDSLHLSVEEKKHLIAFMKSLDEAIPKIEAPTQLPASRLKTLSNRKIGGNY